MKKHSLNEKFYFSESKHVQTKRSKGNGKRLIDDHVGERVLNNQIVSTSLDNSEPCSPGEKIPNDIVSRSYTFSQLLAHFLLFPSNFYNSSSVLGNFYSGLKRILLFLVFEVYVLF